MYSGEHAETKQGLGRSILSFVAMVALVLLLSWGLRTFVVQAYEIPSGSMEHTIEIGDMVFSEKISYLVRDVEAGDIVTFEDPEVEGRIMIKRVIAVGGQTVELIDGRVVVDGVALDEPYTNGLPSEPLATPGGRTVSYPYVVPEGYLWVMGDNRTNSQDSRVFGAVEESSVTGRGVLTYWPLSRFGLLE